MKNLKIKLIAFFCLSFVCFGLVGCSSHSHSLGEWQVISTASCTKNEVWARECPSCGYQEMMIVKQKTGHKYKSEVVPPTINQKGYTKYTCHCGDMYMENYKYLISFVCDSINTKINISDLPEVQSAIYERNQTFTGVPGNDIYKPVGYYNELNGQEIEIGEVFKNSTIVKVMWDYINPPQEPHEHNYVATETVNPTTTEKGYTLYECTCGEGSYQADYTYLISFISECENTNLAQNDLPTLQSEVYEEEQEFTGINNTETLKVIGYYNNTTNEEIEIGDIFTNSTVIKVMWDYITQPVEPEPPVGPEEPHEHNYVATETVNPTTTDVGYTLYECACGEDSYKSDFKYLVTYISKAENGYILESELPKIDSEIYSENQTFKAIENNGNYKVVGYKNYSNDTSITVGQTFNNSITIKLIWDYITIPAEIQRLQQIENIAQKIEKLEEISIQYNTEKSSTNSAINRVLQYIRSVRYSGDDWNVVCGTLESNFAEYVVQNQGSFDLSELQTISYIEVPKTGEKVDFVHMIATLNAITNSKSTKSTGADLAGWGGDLCSLVEQLVNTSLTGTALNNKARELFNAQTSSTFGSQDVCADFDAVNLYTEYTLQTTKSLATAFLEYYSTITTSVRTQNFYKATFNTYTDSSTFANDIITRLKNNMYIVGVYIGSNKIVSGLIDSLGINFTTHAEYFTVASQVFAEYLISNYIMVNSQNFDISISTFNGEESETNFIDSITTRTNTNISIGRLEFDLSNVNTIQDIKKIKITLRVTNNSSSNIGVYFSSKIVDGQAQQSDVLLTKHLSVNERNIVLISMSPYSVVFPNETVDFVIEYELLELPTAPFCIDLSLPENMIYLNIEEYNEVLISNC